MAAEECMFVRTVLGLSQAVISDDSSLALPSEERLARAAGGDGAVRKSRVEQQVQQMTLSRKAKRSTIKGSISNGQLTSSTPSRSGPTKVFPPSVHNDSSGPSRHMIRMNRRYWTSLRFPQVDRGECGLFRSGSSGNGFNWGAAGFTLPAMRSVSSIDRLHMTFPLQNSACSEMLNNPRPFVSGSSATLRLPNKSVYEDNLDDVFLPDTPLRAENQKVFWETINRTPNQQGGAMWAAQNTPLMVQDVRQRQETVRRQPSVVSTYATKVAVAKQQEAAVDTLKNGKRTAPMTMKMAVNLLSEKNEEVQIAAANFIQNRCFSNIDSKNVLSLLRGIPKLLKLLESDSSEVQQAATAALRNAIYDNNDNKMEVKDHEGVGVILRLLKANRDTETRRQLTGLLWNLSSHDMLKEQLGREAVKPVTDSVLVPCSGIREGDDPKLDLLADPEVFLNATGCLRNVSSAGPNARKSMRDCEGLIDSLVYYIRGTIADYNPDDQALENCVCILHNLTYQFECEVSENIRPVVQESRLNAAADTKRAGCLVRRNNKFSAEEEQHSGSDCPVLEENCNPHGVEWLWNSITVRMYLSLLAISNRKLTQEASLGAMQNLTAGNGLVSQAMAQTIILREGGLQQVRKVLQEGEEDVKRASVCLFKNMSRFKELHSVIVNEVLPELVAVLHNSDADTMQTVEVTSVCQILNNLSQTSVPNARAILKQGVLPKIIKISSKERYGSTKAGQAASVLLHTLWKHSELHSSYKKVGFRKTDFINSRTVKAVNSARN